MAKQKKQKKSSKIDPSIDLKKIYPLEEAIPLVKKISRESFDASMEVHVRTGIDPKKGEQVIRASVTLPHGTGKTKKIAVFAEGEKAQEATAAGADVVGGPELIATIKQTGKADFDVAVATPDMMKHMASIAKVLGPKGLMPSPKNETVTPNVKAAIEAIKRGKSPFKNDDSGNVHLSFGRKSFDDAKLIENLSAFLDTLKKNKPAAAKGTFLKTVTICTTMGPAVKVEVK
ncbi:MAG: 50S ribosomal protein L1 [Patescibacteria group bacterium]